MVEGWKRKNWSRRDEKKGARGGEQRRLLLRKTRKGSLTKEKGKEEQWRILDGKVTA